MWIFVGASIVCIVYPIVEEWLQRRRDVEHLAAMRKHAALGDRWDVVRGQWIDEKAEGK
jgi:hypothetical protein